MDKQPPSATLLGLPRELRFNIFEHLFNSTITHSLGLLADVNHEQHLSNPVLTSIVQSILNPPLLQTCHQLRNDASEPYLRSLDALLEGMRKLGLGVELLLDSRELESTTNNVGPEMVDRMYEVAWGLWRDLREIEKVVEGTLRVVQGTSERM